MLSKYLVYGLLDPRDGTLRYVGKSSTGMERAKQHTRPSSCRSGHNWNKTRWYRELDALGLRPVPILIEEAIDPKSVNALECFYIASFRSVGAELFNKLDGGELEYTPGSRKVSRETRQRLSESHKGQRITEEVKKKISEANKGKKKPPEMREKMKEVYRNNTALHEKLSAQKGRPFSDEVRVRMSRGCGGSAIVDENGTIYPSMAEAARQLGVRRGAISRMLRGIVKHVEGHTFKKVETV